MLGFGPVTTSTRDAIWETTGYDTPSLARFTNGAFQGYSMGPGYYGKTFYIWPPDPRYTAGADPTVDQHDQPDPGHVRPDHGRLAEAVLPEPQRQLVDQGVADRRQQPAVQLDRGLWNSQDLGGTVNYVPNYDAILGLAQDRAPDPAPGPAGRPGLLLHRHPVDASR